MSRRVQINLPDRAHDELLDYAKEAGMGQGSAGRDLLLRALESVGRWPPTAKKTDQKAAA